MMRALLCLWLFFPWLVAGPAAAAASGQPSAKPVFAVDPGVHAGNAYRLVATPDERRLVSVGLDKTLRIWDVDSGRQLQRLVLPVAGRRDGQLFALALSPDGSLAAVGGNLYSLGPGRSVAIVSLHDGRIVRAFPGFESPVTALAWSADGRLLAVGLDDDSGGKDHGLRIIDSESGRRVYEDSTLTGNLTALAFRGDRTLFATAHNFPATSRVVLYKPAGETFNRVAERTLTDRGAFRAYWSADQRAIFVHGHSLYDGESLAPLPYRLNRQSLPPGVRVLLTRESPDGSHVFGAANSRESTRGVIRRWSGSGYQRQNFEDVLIPDRRVADLVPLRNGMLGYVAEDGAVAAVGANMQLAWRNARATADLDGHPEALRVSIDGRRVALPVANEQGTRWIAFTLDEPGFSNADPAPGQWLAPLAGRAGMTVAAWQGAPDATVNGQPLPKASRRERSLSVAVHSREDALVFGSSLRLLRKVDGQGKELWLRKLEAEVVAVNLIEGRGLVVAATIDGFLHLLRWSDGEPLISYYLQPGDRKWLAISRAGFYEAGVGAADHAGWIVGSDPGRTADFFPLSRFRKNYLLPGMVRNVFALGDQRLGVIAAKRERERRRSTDAPATPTRVADDAAAREVLPAAPGKSAATASEEIQSEEIAAPPTERLPPVIDVIEPGYETSVREPRLTLRYRVRTPVAAPMTRIRVRINGIELPQAADSSAARALRDETRELKLDLPREDAEVQLLADNAVGVSVPAVIRVRYLGEKKAATERGDLYVLAVGVSRYDKPEYRLDLAAKDADDFAELIGRQEGAFYRKVVVRKLVDAQASKRSVEAALAWLKASVGARDTAMVFLAGHGINDGRGDYLYLPRDADVARLDDTGVTFSLIRRTLTSLPGRTLMFVDTCHAGNVVGSSRQRLDNTEAINELASVENNLIVFASSTGMQESIEDLAWGNGAFTKALLEGLGGEADLKKRGRITYKQLDAYVADRVDELTRGQQTPVTPVLQGIPDFIIALVAQLRR